VESPKLFFESQPADGFQKTIFKMRIAEKNDPYKTKK